MLRVGLRAASINRKYNFQINTDKSALFMCTPCSEWSSNNTLVDSFISHTVYASPILCMRRCLHITAQTKRRRRLMLWISSARCRTCHWHQLLLQLKSCAWHWQRGSGVFTCLDRLVFRIFCRRVMIKAACITATVAVTANTSPALACSTVDVRTALALQFTVSLHILPHGLDGQSASGDVYRIWSVFLNHCHLYWE